MPVLCPALTRLRRRNNAHAYQIHLKGLPYRGIRPGGPSWHPSPLTSLVLHENGWHHGLTGVDLHWRSLCIHLSLLYLDYFPSPSCFWSVDVVHYIPCPNPSRQITIFASCINSKSDIIDRRLDHVFLGCTVTSPPSSPRNSPFHPLVPEYQSWGRAPSEVIYR